VVNEEATTQHLQPIFTSEQGTKMGRRSLLHVKIAGSQGAEGIYVGSYVTPIAEGVMKLNHVQYLWQHLQKLAKRQGCDAVHLDTGETFARQKRRCSMWVFRDTWLTAPILAMGFTFTAITRP
jgi:hypothetical protein